MKYLICRVFIETSVLVACSVHAVIDQLGAVEDEFYKISQPLFEVLQKFIKERIGITTFTVEEEARAVLNTVVLKRLNERLESNPELKQKVDFFRAYSAILDICSDNMDRNCSILVREPIPIEEKNKLVLEVAKMYQQIEELDLFDFMKTKPKPVNRRLEKLAKQIYQADLEKHIAPIIEFIERKPPGLKDYEILAEAAYLASLRDSSIPFFVASTDQHIAPFRKDEKLISDRIKKKFNMICDWPNVIAEEVYWLLRK